LGCIALGNSPKSLEVLQIQSQAQKKKRQGKNLVSGLINQFDYEHLGCSPARFRAFGAALHTHATHNCLIYYYLYLVFGVSESLGDLSLNGFQNTNFLIFICVLLAWLGDKQFPCPCPLFPLFFPII